MQDGAVDLSLSDIRAGDKAEVVWTVAAGEIDAFAALSEDRNPLHMDATWARRAGFADRVAHGLLLGAKLSGLIGMKLPGRRCLLLEQTLAYPNPVYAGDKVTLTARVGEVHADLSLVTLKISGVKATGEKVARGTVTCKILS